ncbi:MULTISPECIES: SDR family NAD(P)-dependent oxidoreductase [unclassified Pseudomonas]|uniref:SDR family NAD(P)-dependent oxidoreductase n=1 Tax=unclassified Pseudomonas TaxID=196821 RepID=UPI0035C20C70
MYESYDSLAGQVAVITGAGRGIGEVIAGTLALAGMTVVMLGRSGHLLSAAAERICCQGAKAYAMTLDVTDVTAVQQCFAQINDVHGAIDLLVNNAGNMGPLGNTWDVDVMQWWKTIETHLLGSFLCTHAVMPLMPPHKPGRIINIVSHAGVYRWPTASAYSVAKAALIKFTENVAVEAKSTRIKLFAYHPGIVIGTGLVSNLRAVPAASESAHAHLLAWVEEQRLAGNSVTASDSANGVLRLATGDYDALNGRYISVHDDLELLLRQAPEIKFTDALTLRLKPLDFNDPFDL